MLVDEIEGMVFVVVSVLMHRTDLFLAMQDFLFPSIVVVSGVVSLARNWRRAEKKPDLPPVETLELAVLTQRIGATQ